MIIHKRKHWIPLQRWKYSSMKLKRAIVLTNACSTVHSVCGTEYYVNVVNYFGQGFKWKDVLSSFAGYLFFHFAFQQYIRYTSGNRHFYEVSQRYDTNLWLRVTTMPVSGIKFYLQNVSQDGIKRSHFFLDSIMKCFNEFSKLGTMLNRMRNIKQNSPFYSIV